MARLRSLLFVLLIGGLPAGGARESGEAAASVDVSFDAMATRLDVMAAGFEDRKDVKCWTSFKKLETFVAGCQLAPASTHLKSAVVIDWIDQVWRTAVGASGSASSIGVAAFDKAARKHFRWDCIEHVSCTFHVGDRQLIIPYRDVDNYCGTVEPIRVVQTLVRRLKQQNASRPRLDSAAVDSAVRFAAILSTVLLKESNRMAVGNNHETIQDKDILAAGRHIAQTAGFAAFDPDAAAPQSATKPANVDKAHETMLTDIRNKMKSLDAFNRAYSRDVLKQDFTRDISKQEAEWAKRPVSAEAARLYKADILAGLAAWLYTACARENPDSDPLTGVQMQKTILRNYPHVTDVEGVVSLFPESHIARILLDEASADAFRDTGWHWRALERAVVELRRRGRSLPALDLYAMEELSEFLSIYAVGFVMISGALADRENHDVVSPADLELAFQLFSKAHRTHLATPEDVRMTPAPRTEDRFETEARASLEAAYIEEIFSDVTALSGIDFAHESSQPVRDSRLSLANDLRKAPAAIQSRAMKSPGSNPLGEVPFNGLGIAGGGVAVADVDSDGLPDIYLVNGKEDQLWKNLGDLRFKNVTRESGLACKTEGRGAYFVDYDNDGDPDLFVTQVYAPSRLFRNRGNGTFEDVTAAAGLPLREDRISHAATWFDFDNDGFLDVYVCNFGDWLAGEVPLFTSNSRHGQPNLLYRNRGDGTFEDVTERTGAGDTGWTQAVSHFDANGDGWQDLYLANDFGTDVILLNHEGKRFVDGTPRELEGNFHHGMSVSFTDFNRDGIEDIYVSNIAMFSFVQKHVKPGRHARISVSRRTVANLRMVENNLFLVSSGNTYEDRHHRHFQRSLDGNGWAWDADFFDFDNDGAEDLYIANGRERYVAYNMERNVLYKQFRGHFYNVSKGSGADFRSNTRGVVHADLDLDGDLDLIVNNFEGPAVLLRNNLQRHHWLRVTLRGTSSNRDSIGALVKVRTADGVQVRRVRGGSGYLSKEPNGLHFGLGRNGSVEKIDIVWPSGRRLSIENPAVDREHHIVEPS